MSNSFGDYLDNDGTVPAIGKMFKLYGMEIGVFQGMTSVNGKGVFTFIHASNGRMDIPMQSPLSIPVVIGGKEVKEPIMTPVLYDVVEA